jgi:hypothetical protein
LPYFLLTDSNSLESKTKLLPFVSNPDFDVNIKNSQGIPALLIAVKLGRSFFSSLSRLQIQFSWAS